MQMSSKPKTPTARRQLLTCGLLCALAATLMLLGHAEPRASSLVVGLPLWQQGVISLAFAACAAAVASIALAIPRLRQAFSVPGGIRDIDLSGSKPLLIGLAAGVGEEFLFRAALQPLLGLWWASSIFALAHVRTAAFADGSVKKFAYLANVFLAGVMLGLVYQNIGLLAAVLIHATIDVVSLASLHRLKAPDLAAPAT
jgi:membrane protease YdiL (CAAX protease family)